MDVGVGEIQQHSNKKNTDIDNDAVQAAFVVTGGCVDDVGGGDGQDVDGNVLEDAEYAADDQILTEWAGDAPHGAKRLIA